MRWRKKTSSKCLRIVVVSAGGGFLGRIRSLALSSFRNLLRTVPIRVWVIPIGIVVVGGAGIDGVKHDAQDATLHVVEQVARPSKSCLGRFAAANHEQHTIGMYGYNHSIRGSHDRRRVHNDELKFRAQLGDALSESVRGEQICRIRWERSGGNGHQIGNRGMWTRHEIQTGCAGEIGTQTGIFPWTEIEETADSPCAELGSPTPR